MGSIGSYAHSVLCQQYHKEGVKEKWKKRKVQPQLQMHLVFIHVFYKHVLYLCFTFLILLGCVCLLDDVRVDVYQQFYFQAKSRFPEFQTYFGSKAASGFNLQGLY